MQNCALQRRALYIVRLSSLSERLHSFVNHTRRKPLWLLRSHFLRLGRNLCESKLNRYCIKNCCCYMLTRTVLTVTVLVTHNVSISSYTIASSTKNNAAFFFPFCRTNILIERSVGFGCVIQALRHILVFETCLMWDMQIFIQIQNFQLNDDVCITYIYNNNNTKL